MPDWNTIIVGGGPAGLCAAAAIAATGRSTVVIDSMGGGGELMNLGPLLDVDDCLTGPDLAARLLEQASSAGAEIAFGQATNLIRTATGWQMEIDGDTHTAETVILAVGLAPGTLGVGSEATFEGQGLSHCGTCDGPLYANQPVVIAGDDRWAQHEATELAATASTVTLVGPSAPVLPNITSLQGRVIGLHGEGGLESVAVQTTDGTTTILPARAIFIQTGRRPALGWLPGDLALDQNGAAITNACLRTNLPGLYAIGDARAGSPRTIANAIADAKLLATREP
jgi:thioredoxin reductase (NADPH)